MSPEGYLIHRSGGWAVLESHAFGQAQLGFYVNPPSEATALAALASCFGDRRFDLERLKPTVDGPRYAWREGKPHA